MHHFQWNPGFTAIFPKHLDVACRALVVWITTFDLLVVQNLSEGEYFFFTTSFFIMLFGNNIT